MTIDPQDPLPEPHFFWRRWFTYGTTLVALGLAAFALHKLAADDPATAIGLAAIAFAAWQSTLYMVAPSAETIARIVAHIVKLKRP